MFAAAFTEAHGQQACAELLDRAPGVTAVVAANDRLAIGCYDALEARGLACPGDVSVTGFNDMPFVDRLRPPLTSVRVPQREIGTVAADLLLEPAQRRLAGRPPGPAGADPQRPRLDRAPAAPAPEAARRRAMSGDERVEAAIRHWAGRFIANGIDYNDFVRTTASISRWEDWLDAWTATAEAHAELARAALERGHRQSAGEAFARAAVTYHFSKFVWVLDPERNRRNTEAAISAMYAAHAILDPGAERIEAPLDDAVVAANLRLPPGPDPAPLVVLIPGPGLHQGGVLSMGVGVPHARHGHALARRPGSGRDRLSPGHPSRLRGRRDRGARRGGRAA